MLDSIGFHRKYYGHGVEVSGSAFNGSLSSKDDLRNMLHKEWPFFTDYDHLVRRCLDNNSCGGVQDIIQSLGKYDDILLN